MKNNQTKKQQQFFSLSIMSLSLFLLIGHINLKALLPAEQKRSSMEEFSLVSTYLWASCLFNPKLWIKQEDL